MTRELKEYLLEIPDGSSAKAEVKVVEDKSTEVILRKGGKRVIPTKVQDSKTPASKPQESKGSPAKAQDSKIPAAKTKALETKAPAGDVKKPVRRRGKEQGQAEEPTESSSLLSAPTDPAPVSPVSPVIEETPIGSIKDKVKALQQKVEAEQKGRNVTSSKPSQLPVMNKSSPKPKEGPKTKQGSPKSPKTEAEKLEETMSVKDLMKAFQTGQDPSKRKSGLFEVKSSTAATTEQTTDVQPTKSSIKVPTSKYSEKEISLDATPAPTRATEELQVEKGEQSSPRPLSDVTETIDFQNGDSSDSLKHEGVADSPSASPGDVTPHLSSEDSLKHEGLATPGTSPECLPLSPKSALQHIARATVAVTAVRDESKGKDKSGDSGLGTTDDQPSTEMTLPVSSSEAAEIGRAHV